MIKPVSLTTKNVAKEIESVSQNYSIPISKLYIEINSVVTFIKDGESKFVEIYDEDFDEYKKEKYLRDRTVEFEQEYEVSILPRYRGYPFENLISEIEFDKRNVSAYFVIKKGSKLEYYSGLYQDFLNYIIQEKLKSNVMLFLFDTDYEEIIKQYVDVIEKIKHLTFKEDKKILVAQGIDEIKSFKAKVNMTIEENYENEIVQEDENVKVNYADRNFLLSCSEGEELFEFIKPKQGEHGRDCKGKIIKVETIDLEAKPVFTVDNNIEVEDSFENIKYLSSKSGYLIKKENQYEVSNSIDIDEISFKTTGTIDSDLDREITINVIKDNPLEDAIEKGMTVKVQNLFITGSIGPHTEVEARSISISGQTHNDSVIKCMKAEIGVHKGKITGREVEVHTLEGGEIIADLAIVHNAMNGKIIAKRIEITTLGSHVIMSASQYIKIERVRGEENKFIFESSADSGLDSHASDNKNYLEKLHNEIETLKEVFKNSTTKLKKNLEQCKKIKASIIKDKTKGIQISPTLIKNFKLCRMMQTRYKKSKESLEQTQEQYEKEELRQSSNITDIKDAQLTTNEALRGFNHIVYKLNKNSETDIDIELKTDESMREKVFKLVENRDGVLEIVNSK